MVCRPPPIGQAAVIVVAALAVGTAHALVKPVKSWESGNTSVPTVTPTPPAHTSPGNQTPAAPVNPPVGANATPPAPAAQPGTPVAVHDDRMVTLARFKELMGGSQPLQIVDAREPTEFAEGHIAGAINIPPGEFFGKVPDVVNQRLSRDLPMVVYCSGGNCDASKLVAMRLKDLGFAQTFVYEDGWTGWTKAGEAVEK